jgi:hypothetical protein
MREGRDPKSLVGEVKLKCFPMAECSRKSSSPLPVGAPSLPFYRPREGPRVHEREKEKKKEKNREEEGPEAASSPFCCRQVPSVL